MGQPQQPTLKSQDQITWIAKYFAPIILTAFCVGMLSGKFVGRRLVVLFPIMVAAAFFLSLATVELREGVLRYKRFRTWTTIDEKTVLASGEFWPGILGYIRLSHYVFPWKRLYFVLDERPGLNPFARGDSPFLEYLSKTTDRIHQDASTRAHAPNQLSNRALLIVGLAAASFYALLHFLLPSFPLSTFLKPPLNASPPALVVIDMERLMLSLLQSFPLTLALCAIFILLAIYRRRKADAWTYALVAGVTFAAVLFHVL